MPSHKTPRGRVPVFHTLLVFRCPTTLSEALAEQAAEQGTSISAVIRELLRAGLKEGDATAANYTPDRLDHLRAIVPVGHLRDITPPLNKENTQ